ncbi:MAG: serine/threonine protein kinase [Ruminococcus sp.]|nr:serine/threonine protein kinase [Ruminococcus sp.]
MNTRLPTTTNTEYYWAQNSRELLLAFDVITDLERELTNTKYEFFIDPYYKDIMKNCYSFLTQYGGCFIPQGMEKVELYYTEPIFIKKDSINIGTTSVEQRYAVLKKIGSGSYANVYCYTDSFYNRKFALKRAKSDLDEKELTRFRKEYEYMASLSSPYIVEVYNYDETKHQYVMEYIDCTLANYILNSDPKPNIIDRHRIVIQVLNAFSYIHSKKLLHRDISPNNILLKKYDGINVVKISDFGLVKVPDSALTSYDSTLKGCFNDPALAFEGFANYRMEHETYALTKIVAYIMTGSAMLMPNFDEKLQQFCQKGLSSDKDNRFHSVDEMIRAFNQMKNK